jgi:hypothetical protein
LSERISALRLAQLVLAAGHRLAQAHVVARGKLVEVVADDGQRQVAGLRLRQVGQLQRQALGGVAGADAGRVEILQVLQRDLQLVEVDLQLRRQHLGQFLQALRQVAVVVERLDQQPHQAAIALGERHHRQLRAEVVAQRGGGGLDLGIRGLVVVALVARR